MNSLVVELHRYGAMIRRPAAAAGYMESVGQGEYRTPVPPAGHPCTRARESQPETDLLPWASSTRPAGSQARRCAWGRGLV